MLQIKKFSFNPFQTNTYIVADESTKECAIIDAACESNYEKQILADHIMNNELTPVRLLYTHCHVDHTLGNTFIEETYGLKPEVHPDGKIFWETAREFSSVFQVSFDKAMKPTSFLQEGDRIKIGVSLLEVLHTPGHAAGSICFYCREQGFVVVGDVLFNGSIGRTDLPTGNFDVLMESIREKLFTLDDDTVVYPGHGPETTIGYEKVNNPYVGEG
jgi:glyoxylase-like metal-dependent hydrolase (beta-lactamase superfamily II)